MTALLRSTSLTNLEINPRDPRTGLPENIQLTWMKKSKKVASLTGSHVVEFNNIRMEEQNEQPHGTSIQAEAVCMESDAFLLCGNMWTLKIYPYGVDEDSEFLSIKLQNQSKEVVNAYYSLSIKRSEDLQDENRLNMWVDPDVDKLHFQPLGHEDSAWGVDDFLALSELYDESNGYMDIWPYDPVPAAAVAEGDEVEVQVVAAEGKATGGGGEGEGEEDAVANAQDDKEVGKEKGDTKAAEAKEVKGVKGDGVDKAASLASSIEVPFEIFQFRNAKGERIFDRLYVEVQMMVYGEVKLAAHPLTQAIEQRNASEDELVAIANKDLNLIKEATSGGGPTLDFIEKMQDRLLETLCPPEQSAAAADKKGGNGHELGLVLSSKGSPSATGTGTGTGSRPTSRGASRLASTAETSPARAAEAKDSAEAGADAKATHK